MEFLNDPGTVLSLLGSGVSVVIWLIRLEGKIKAHEEVDTLRFGNLAHRYDAVDKTVRELRDDHSRLEGRIVDKLSLIEKSLSKIEGRLSFHDRDAHK